MGTVNKPASKAEPTTDVPAKAWGGGTQGTDILLFFLLPQRISSLYNETEVRRIKIYYYI